MREFAILVSAILMFSIGLMLSNGQREIAARLTAMETALGLNLTPEQRADAIDQQFDAIKAALDKAFPSE